MFVNFGRMRVMRQVTVGRNWRRIETIDRVSSLITGALAKRGLAEHAMASLALHRINGWIAGAFASKNPPAKAERIAEGVLTIGCSHSVVLQEMQVRLPELRAFIAAECPFAAIADIRLSRDDGKAGNALAPGNPPT